MGTNPPFHFLFHFLFLLSCLALQIQMEDLKNSIGGRSSGKSMDPNSTFYASSSKLYKT